MVKSNEQINQFYVSPLQVNRLISKHLFWITYILAFIVSVIIAVISNVGSVSPLLPVGNQTRSCAQPFSENPTIFDVYVTDQWMSSAIKDALCQDPIIRRQFGNVSVMVGANDFDTFKNINYGLADLALVKQNQIDAFASDEVQGYREIARYSNYSAFFIAKDEKPILSKEYFLGKRIGLLDYPSSRSGHIQPKIKLQSLDISDANADILYYNSHHELREKLLVDEVDLISSYWDPSDEERFSKNYITPINEEISGARWFLRQQSRNIDLICSLQRMIKTISTQHPSSYYATVDIPERPEVICHDS